MTILHIFFWLCLCVFDAGVSLAVPYNQLLFLFVSHCILVYLQCECNWCATRADSLILFMFNYVYFLWFYFGIAFVCSGQRIHAHSKLRTYTKTQNGLKTEFRASNARNDRKWQRMNKTWCSFSSILWLAIFGSICLMLLIFFSVSGIFLSVHVWIRVCASVLCMFHCKSYI